MIRFSQLTLARSGKILINRADVTIFPGERVGLVGENGAGKSTLLSAIRGESSPEAGDLMIPPSWRISHVAQETAALPISALQFVMEGDDELMIIQQALNHAEATEQHEELGELYARMADIDGFAAEARASTLLHGLGFSDDDLVRPVADFSGGWRVRLNLARALGARADLMLLDEPTNHLDIEAVLWLEQWLCKAQCTMIIVSHDREFLDTVATHTLSLANQTLTKYTGGYSQYERQYAEQIKQQNIAAEKQSAEAKKLQSFVDRFRAKASKAKQAQSRLKRLDKMQSIATYRQPLPVDFSFLAPDRMPDPLVTLVQADCGYSESSRILTGVTLEIRAGQRIGLLGQNGNGKSTLIKTLVGDLDLLNGTRVLGKGAVIGYFAQHQVDTLHGDDTALSHFRRVAPTTREQSLRDFLGRFAFSGPKVEQAIESFSGGEKARLALATIIWQKPNLLLLDEPTNHLDLPSREALAEALFEFAGALVVVSHDRHLLESTTDEYIRVHAGSVKPFDGDLDDYNAVLNTERIAANQAAAAEQKAKAAAAVGDTPTPTAAPAPIATPAPVRKKPINKELNKELQALEKKIASLQSQVAHIDLELAKPDAYSPAKAQTSARLGLERSELTDTLSQLEEQWLNLQLSLEQLDLH